MATIYGNNRDNRINGTIGTDYLYGQGGNDTVLGGASDDFIYDSSPHGSSNDVYYGGAGDDWLWSEKGNDTLVGGPGDDWFVVLYSGGHLHLKGGKGHDTVRIILEEDGADTSHIHMKDMEDVLIL